MWVFRRKIIVYSSVFSLQFSVFIYSAKLSRRNGKMISSPTGPLTCFLAGRRGTEPNASCCVHDPLIHRPFVARTFLAPLWMVRASPCSLFRRTSPRFFCHRQRSDRCPFAQGRLFHTKTGPPKRSCLMLCFVSCYSPLLPLRMRTARRRRFALRYCLHMLRMSAVCRHRSARRR